jgi:hypothetical protein
MLPSGKNRLPGLTPAVISDTTTNAQRFLASAFDTVDDLLNALDVVRTHRKLIDGKGFKGSLASNEQDLLRAGLALAGAGLDSSIKRLVRDVLPILLDDAESEGSRDLHGFATRQIGVQQVVDPSRTAALFLAVSPRQALIDEFVEDLTGSSIQSVAAVHRIATVLGLPKKHAVRAAITALRPAFVARNQVAHELDLQVPLGLGDRQKRTRTMNKTIPLIHALLDVPQRLINETATTIQT